MSKSIFPWQKDIWQALWQRYLNHELPHALLFSGIPGIGKKQFAKAFAESLFCASPNELGQGCGQCRSCHFMEKEAHPDLVWLKSEEGQPIKIDQVREVVDFVNETPLLGGYRVIVIESANKMNINAANALLKTLEEPTANVVFILLSEQGLSLLPTIKSRCQTVIFNKPSYETSLIWLRDNQNTTTNEQDLMWLLKYTEGAPLLAKDLLEEGILELRKVLFQSCIDLSSQRADPLAVAVEWQDKSHSLLINLLLAWLKDVLRLQLTHNTNIVMNEEYQNQLLQLTQKLSINQLLEYIDHLQAIYKKLFSSISLNRQLLVEDIFIRWVQLCS